VLQASERRNLRLAHVGHRAGADCTPASRDSKEPHRRAGEPDPALKAANPRDAR
jgi:hypothetical protein